MQERFAIYDISVAGELPSELKTISGLSSRERLFGTGIYALRSDPNDINSSVDYSVIVAPNQLVAGTKSGRGVIEYFNDVKFAPSEPHKLVGSSTNEYFGTSILEFNDIDSDGRPDYLIGAPGARCNGVSYGGIYAYSGLDGEYDLEICANYAYQRLGFDLLHFDESNYFAVVELRRCSMRAPTIFLNITRFLTKISRPMVFQSQVTMTTCIIIRVSCHPILIDRVYREDYQDRFLYGEPGRYNNEPKAGRVGVAKFQGSYFEYQCGVIAEQGDAMLGASISYTVFNSQQWVWAGAPGYQYDETDNTKEGEVSLLLYPSCTTAEDSPYDSSKVLTITASHPDIMTLLGTEAASGFGSGVLSLGDLDGPSGVTTKDGELVNGVEYLLITNSDAKQERLNTTPEMFVFRIDSAGIGFTSELVLYDSGESGSMFAGSAIVIEDLNGDGISEFIVSHPYGVGRYGLTGNVKIYIGNEVAKKNPAGAVIQSLFNPEDQQSNFGVELLYADITGDGLKDFVVGAPNYSSESRRNIGAIYIFPVKPIKESLQVTP